MVLKFLKMGIKYAPDGNPEGPYSEILLSLLWRTLEAQSHRCKGEVTGGVYKAGREDLSRRPHHMPGKTPDGIEELVVKERTRTNFGPQRLPTRRHFLLISITSYLSLDFPGISLLLRMSRQG